MGLSRAGSVGANKLVRFSGLWFKRYAGDDGFRRNHEKVRIIPRHDGCGRLCCDQPATGGHTIIRHALKSRFTAAGIALPAGAGRCREDKK